MISYTHRNTLLCALLMVLGISTHSIVVEALESSSFSLFHEAPNYSDRIAKDSDSFTINEDGTTWYMKPLASISYQMTTSPPDETLTPQPEPDPEPEGTTGGSGTSGGGGSSGGGGRRPCPPYCDPEPDPEPEPDPQPEPEPDPEPHPEPEPDPQPDPEPEPEHESDLRPSAPPPPVPQPELVIETEEELRPSAPVLQTQEQYTFAPGDPRPDWPSYERDVVVYCSRTQTVQSANACGCSWCIELCWILLLLLLLILLLIVFVLGVQQKTYHKLLMIEEGLPEISTTPKQRKPSFHSRSLK